MNKNFELDSAPIAKGGTNKVQINILEQIMIA